MNTKKRLYRDADNGKISGVCAGIAEYFSIETWLVRILTVTAFLLTTGPFIFVGYIVLWAVLDKKPVGDEEVLMGSGSAYDGDKRYTHQRQEDEPVEVKDAVWKAGQSPKDAFHQVQQRYIRTENRLRRLESYVTSNEFQLNRELNNL